MWYATQELTETSHALESSCGFLNVSIEFNFNFWSFVTIPSLSLLVASTSDWQGLRGPDPGGDSPHGPHVRRPYVRTTEKAMTQQLLINY
jgi:hypothetical protein